MYLKSPPFRRIISFVLAVTLTALIICPDRTLAQEASGASSPHMISPNSSLDAKNVEIDDPEIVRCLCLEQAVSKRASDLTIEHNQYDQAANLLQNEATRLTADKEMVDTHDANAIAAYRARLDTHDVNQKAFNDMTTPRYQHVLDLYNQVAKQYSETCTGRTFNQLELRRLQKNLSCSINDAPALP